MVQGLSPLRTEQRLQHKCLKQVTMKILYCRAEGSWERDLGSVGRNLYRLEEFVEFWFAGDNQFLAVMKLRIPFTTSRVSSLTKTMS